MTESHRQYRLECKGQYDRFWSPLKWTYTESEKQARDTLRNALDPNGHSGFALLEGFAYRLMTRTVSSWVEVPATSSTTHIDVSEYPLTVGSGPMKDAFLKPLCGRRQHDGVLVVLPPPIHVGDMTNKPEVLRELAAGLIEAAEWLEGVSCV